MTEQKNGAKLVTAREPIVPQGIRLTTRRSAYLALGLDQAGKVVMRKDEDLGVDVPALVNMDTIWFAIEEAARLLKNPVFAHVWLGRWDKKMGRYTFDGDAMARAIVRSSGAVPVPGHAELKRMETTAKETASLVKDKKPVTAEHHTALVKSTFDALRALGLTREQMLSAVRVAAPELGSQPQHQTVNR